MYAHAPRGDVPANSSPETIRSEVSAALAELWPLLLKASNAADGPDPASAAEHLRAGAELLRCVADKLP